MTKSNKLFYSALILIGLTLSAGTLQAHTPLFDCFDNGDETITCEGGFSDGGSSTGISVRVLDSQGKVLAQAEMNEAGSVSFDLPNQEYSVVFDAGAGHHITVFGDDIY